MLRRHFYSLLIAAVLLGAIWGLMAWTKTVAEAVAVQQVCRMVPPHHRKPDVCFGVLEERLTQGASQ